MILNGAVRIVEARLGMRVIMHDILTDTPVAYAKRLAKCITDASTVHMHTVNNFGRSPSLGVIKDWIAEARKPGRDYGEAIGLPAFKPEPIPVPTTPPPSGHATPAEIIAQVAHVYGFKAGEVTKRRGGSIYTPARVICSQILYARALARGSMSLPQIGQHLNRDHTTIIHNLRKFNDMRTRVGFDALARETVTTYHEFIEDWGIEDAVYPN